MRSMTRWTMAGALALAATGAVTVLDVDSPTAEAAPSVSRFAGSWSGTWFHFEDGDFGTIDWTISDAGRISGTGHSIPNDFGGAIVGHVGADGDLEMVAAVPNDVPAGGSGYPSQGTAVIDGGGKLVVSFANTFPGGISGVSTFERK